MDLQPGLLVTEDVRLVRPLKSGAMGSIWVAEHLQNKAPLAVKFVSSSRAKEKSTLARFKREAKAAESIDSPNVVRGYGTGQLDDGTPYIIMELLEGESLGEHLDRVGAMSFDRTAAVLTQVARALDAAHALGIVHRDIKPDNIFLCGLDDFPMVKVLDFGMAKEVRVRSDSIITQTGVSVGTPEYMSPEQVLGSKEVDHRSDLWGLAVVAYRCITGVIPFQGETPHSLFFAICKGEFAPLEDAGAPEEFDSWFRKALAPNKDKRFDNAAEMVAAFERTIASAVTSTSGQHDIPSAVEPPVAPDFAITANVAEDLIRTENSEIGPTSASLLLTKELPPEYGGDEETDDDEVVTRELNPQEAASLVEAAKNALDEAKVEESRRLAEIERRRQSDELVAAASVAADFADSNRLERVRSDEHAVISAPRSDSAGVPRKRVIVYAAAAAVAGAVVAALIANMVLNPTAETTAPDKAKPQALPAEPDNTAASASSAPSPRQERPAETAAPAAKGSATTGFLELSCVPRCTQILAKGKLLGGTASGIAGSKIELPAGEHLVTLTGSKGSQQIIRVRIAAGKVTTRRVFMVTNEAPALPAPPPAAPPSPAPPPNNDADLLYTP
ncbi:serine/threonine protein kinase [Desulfobulbus sp. AH-315-M07]|nr:serine/threonine protein kinase [Desulfobulbus sp. AH-315-M07]